jgi:hypothetical protein
MKKDKLVGVFTICRECAEHNGAVWPTGHVATFWTGGCDVCLTEKGVCDVSDWNWPNGKPSEFSLMRRG